MEAINPLNHYYNLFCLSILSENISKVRIAVLLFLKIKLHNVIPKSALIVLMGRHVNKILSFIDCEYRQDGFITPIHKLQPECKTI